MTPIDRHVQQEAKNQGVDLDEGEDDKSLNQSGERVEAKMAKALAPSAPALNITSVASFSFIAESKANPLSTCPS